MTRSAAEVELIRRDRILASRKTAAEALDMSIETLSRKINAGEIRARKDGGAVKVEWAELQAYASRLEVY